MPMSKQEEDLKSLGLTEYEAKAYITLLTLGTSTAEQISEKGNIPLPRVYDTIVELQRKGFVLISKSRPKKFQALPAEKALNHYLEVQREETEKKLDDLKIKIKESVDNIKNIEVSHIPEPKFTIWSMEKKRNITKILDEQKQMAENEILIFSGDMSWIYDIGPMLGKLTKKGIKVRTIMPDPHNENQILKNIKKAQEFGIKVRVGYNGSLRGHIVDNKIASINLEFSSRGVNIPGKGIPEGDEVKKYEMMIFDNPVLISAFRENFEFWWEKLKK